MAELVDVLDLGSSAARRGGSSPSIRTTYEFEMSHILILKATENKDVIDKMIASIEEVMSSYGYSSDQVVIPSAIELPLAVNMFLESKSYDAVIVVGVVINDLNNDTKKMLYKNIAYNLQESSLYYGFILGLCLFYDEDINNALAICQKFASEVASSSCQMIKTIRHINSLGNEDYAAGKLHN